MCENLNDLGRQEPRGCRFIYGDPGDGEWHFCQRGLLKGARLGDATHPPYCARHTKVCHGPSSRGWLARFKLTPGAAAFGDQSMQICGPNRDDGQRMPVDLALSLAAKGVLFHD